MAHVVFWFYGNQIACHCYYEQDINATLSDVIEKCKPCFTTGGKMIKVYKFTCSEGIKWGNLYDSNNPFFNDNTTIQEYAKHYKYQRSEIDIFLTLV